jgi:Calcineurin-like phosphoesterase
MIAPARVRLAVLTDLHVAPTGAADGRWNNPVLLSQSTELLAAAAEAAAAEQVHHLLVLGDAADRGDEASEAQALAGAAGAGAPVWAVPGNHDVALDPDALPATAARTGAAVALDAHVQSLAPGVAVCGVRLTSDDGGRTCRATGLPLRLDPAPALLLVATHYPVMSVKPRLRARGSRHPGNLVNRRDLQRVVATRSGPTVALHGHVHAAVDLAHGHLLQIGCAALAEWPHAWTLIEIDTATSTVAVTRDSVRDTPAPSVDTALAPACTTWRHDGTTWHRAGTDSARPRPAAPHEPADPNARLRSPEASVVASAVPRLRSLLSRFRPHR